MRSAPTRAYNQRSVDVGMEKTPLEIHYTQNLQEILLSETDGFQLIKSRFESENLVEPTFRLW